MSGKKLKTKNQLFKRQKVIDARTIRTEALNSTTSAAATELSESGSMLKVPEFMASREFEVKQLQMAIHKSKSASSTRVFQSLPRKLRRRTASHNIKRIPKRLRNRALREMRKSDQAVTRGTETLSKKRKYGLTARQLYKARMAVKLLRLAAKSKSMKLAFPADATASNHKLRDRIKALQKNIKEHSKGKAPVSRNNIVGSYDSTGVNTAATKPTGRIKYMKRQKTFTWLPSHVWNAKRSHMLKRWGYQIPWSPTQKCFKLTHRLGNTVSASDGAMCCDSSYVGTMVLVAENVDYLKDLVSRLTHGRASLAKYRIYQNWFEGLIYIDNEVVLGPGELLWVSLQKCILRAHPAFYNNVFEWLAGLDKDTLTVFDCRYSISSITLTGAKSLNALSQVLRSTEPSHSYSQFKKFSYVTDIHLLPQKTMFAFDAIDPRHLSNPRRLEKVNVNSDDILELQFTFPQAEIASVLEKMSDPKEREQSYSNQQTFKQLAARRKKMLDSMKRANSIPFEKGADPSFPIVISKLPKREAWLVLLPWFWQLPLWYQLNRVSRVHHMGLRQVQQLDYENSRLYFPDDFPFTQAGHDENSVSKKRVQEALWKRQPVGKRVNYTKIPDVHSEAPVMFPGEIGDPFCCDWRFLQVLQNGLVYLRSCNEATPKMFDSARTAQFDESNQRKLQYINDVVELYGDVCASKYKPAGLPIRLVNHSISKIRLNDSDFTSEHQSLQQQITSTPLPVIAVTCTLLERGHPKDSARIYSIPEKDLAYWRSIAQLVTRANGKRDHDRPQCIPEVSNLIGYATCGTFHLREGCGVCTGFIDAREAVKPANDLVLIRNVGTNVYRVAKWAQIMV
ncbi:LAME_0F15654g1_1 [Lachancea meyersii CBS 8951]|uniref:LAME_0F15654g1_1 n=1 Tax=Lachancea meyersii CBS 8951 TaxID=1266667 RepID=A0A1G4JYK2_9SACH|nr:LAME_0F15654g1_1 [Lachancea meyersii CBS 8951]